MNTSCLVSRWVRWAWAATVLLAACLALAPGLPGGMGPRVEAVVSAESLIVSGTVTCNGRGKLGVEVFAWNRDQGDGMVADTTDTHGAYSVALEAGSYDLIFNPPCDSGCATESRTGIAGPQNQTVNVDLLPGHGISGQVTKAGGQTVRNVSIYAYNINTGTAFGLPPTREDGSYCIGLATGAYSLTFTPPACGGLGPKTHPLDVSKSITLNIALSAGFSVAGRITDGANHGVSGVQIYAHECTSGAVGYGFSPSDANGYYTGTLPLGVYGIRFMPPPDWRLGPVVHTEIGDQGEACPDTRLDVILPAGVKLSGQVTCRGQPLRNVFVFADPLDINICDGLDGVGGYTVDNGSYALPVVTGNYRITIVPPPVSVFTSRTLTRTVTHNEGLSLDYCMLALPLILKERSLP